MRLPATAIVVGASIAFARPASARQAPTCLWDDAGPAPIARLEAPSLSIDGRLVVFGGFEAGLLATPRVDAYDPLADTWTRLADLPLPVTHAGFARDERHLWLVGGFVGNHPGTTSAATWIYDLDTDTWTPGPPLPAPRASGGLVVLGRALHWFGGVSSDRDTDQDAHWVLDLDQPSGWTPAAPLPVARNHFAAVAFAGRAYAIGGQHRHDTAPVDLDLVHAYDPLTDTWTQVADLPFPRSHFEPGTFVLGGRIVISGGRANTLGLAAVSDVTAYDPLGNHWTALAPLPGALLAPGVDLVGERIVLSGGGPSATQPIAATRTRPADASLGGTLRVNCGGGALALGEAWCPDFGPVGGQTFENLGLGDVTGTDDDALYASERSGSDAQPAHLGYRVPLPDGDYEVRLHFAEIYWGAPGGGPGGVGQRVFDVSLEGEVVLDDYDITADVGPVAAAVHAFEVTVADGALDIELVASVDRPKISGFEVLELPNAERYCVAAPNSAGPGASVGTTGSTSVGVDDFWLTASGTPRKATGLFLQGALQAQTPVSGGFLCVGPGFFRLTPVLASDASGAVARRLDLRHPQHAGSRIAPGSTWNFQLWYRDTAAGGSNFSDGVAVTFRP